MIYHVHIHFKGDVIICKCNETSMKGTLRFLKLFLIDFSHIEALKSDKEGGYMHLESKCKVQIPNSYYKGVWIEGVLHPDGKL